MAKPKTPPRPKASPKKVLLASASRPTNLAVLGSGTVGTAALVAAGLPVVGLAVLALGGLAYGAMIAFDFKNERFVRKAHGIVDDPAADVGPLDAPLVPTILPNSLEARDLRALYEQVLASHEQLRGQLVASPDFVKDGLGDAFQRASELVGEAGRVAMRGNVLVRYLAGENAKSIADEIAALDDKARRATDTQARAAWEQAAAGKRRHAALYSAIEGLYDRVRAQLVAIDGSFDEVRARVVKLDAADTAEAVAMGHTIVEQVDQLVADAHELDVAVEQTLQEYA